jgi:uncharacterized protein (TIGR03086 family)
VAVAVAFPAARRAASRSAFPATSGGLGRPRADEFRAAGTFELVKSLPGRARGEGAGDDGCEWPGRAGAVPVSGGPTSWWADGARLLEQAVGYALGAAEAVTPALLHRPTPCREWDLAALLWHVNDGLAALADGLRGGAIALAPQTGAGDPCPAFRARAKDLLGACAAAGAPGAAVAIGGRPLALGVVAGTGAAEIAVHGWDIGQACGRPRPVPDGLAGVLLEICVLIVPEPRHPQFAAPVPAGRAASRSDRLVAFLGREPRPRVPGPRAVQPGSVSPPTGASTSPE